MFSVRSLYAPRMATIISSWTTSSDPETTKQTASRLSPWWNMTSPGATWKTDRRMASALRQQLSARLKAECW